MIAMYSATYIAIASYKVLIRSVASSMDTGKKIAIEIQSLYHGTAAVIEFPLGNGCMYITS